MSTNQCALLSMLVAAFLSFGPSAVPEAQLWQLYQRRDFFSLRSDLPAPTASENSHITFLRAQTDAAFGQYDRSNRALRNLLQSLALNGGLERSARERLMLNERALFHYRAALDEVASSPQPNLSTRNRVALLIALQDTPAERVTEPAETAALHRDRFGAIAANLNGTLLHMGIDTGANLSAISGSAARAAGLRISPVGYRIRSSANKNITADVAIGDLRLEGGIRVSNVVFLVLPARNLRISATRQLDGLVGLPVLSQLGPMQFKRDGRILIASTQKLAAATQSVALVDEDPVVRATFGAKPLLCRLDTGANRTVFYGSPRRAMRYSFMRSGVLTVSHRAVGLQRLVHLPRSAANQTFVECSLGRDVLHQLEPYTLDLQNMRLTLN